MYICSVCNKTFKLKHIYTNHINRKTPCIKQTIKCMKCNRIFISLINLQKHLNKKKSCDNNEIYKCEFCNKQYITKRNYTNHLKIHVNNTQINNINNTNVNITNNVNSNNIINNYITINKFGKEDLSYLTKDKICNILDLGFQAMPELIRETHFNKNHPQNHNVYITNLNKKTILIYDGERWIVTHKENVIDDIISSNEDFIAMNCEELKGTLSERAIERLNRFLAEIDDPEYNVRLKNAIQLILFNYRDIPEHTRNNNKCNQVKNI